MVETLSTMAVLFCPHLHHIVKKVGAIRDIRRAVYSRGRIANI